MEPKKSNTKENIFNILLIFTFLIPVIPVTAFYAYDYLFGEQKEASNTNTFQVTEDTGYEESSDPLRGGSINTPPQSSRAYECSSDCSGHEAGYEWATDNDVCDKYFDGGNSESFAEGVRAYAETNCSTNDDIYYEEGYDYYR